MSNVIELVIGGNTKRSTTGQHPVKIDWDALPEASKDFVIRYGLKQYLADGTAGALNEAEAKEGVETRVGKLESGDLSRARGEGGKIDSVDGRALKNAKAAIRANLKAKSLKATKEKIDEAAKKLVETQPKWKAEAKKELDLEAKAAEALGADFDLDSLLDEVEDEDEVEAEGDDATDE